MKQVIWKIISGGACRRTGEGERDCKEAKCGYQLPLREAEAQFHGGALEDAMDYESVLSHPKVLGYVFFNSTYSQYC